MPTFSPDLALEKIPGDTPSMSWILLLAPPLGALAIWWLLKPFSDNPRFVRELFQDMPVTMFAASSMAGAIILWLVLQILGAW